MTLFNIIRHDEQYFVCRGCGGVRFTDFYLCSDSPVMMKKYQVLKVKVRCCDCSLISLVYHTKIRGFRLLSNDTLFLRS